MFAVSQQICGRKLSTVTYVYKALVAMALHAVFTTILSYFQGYLERVVDRQVEMPNNR